MSKKREKQRPHEKQRESEQKERETKATREAEGERVERKSDSAFDLHLDLDSALSFFYKLKNPQLSPPHLLHLLLLLLHPRLLLILLLLLVLLLRRGRRRGPRGGNAHLGHPRSELALGLEHCEQLEP